MPETIEMGTMIPQRRQLVTESWKSLAPNGALVGAIFYRRLFEIDPALRQMFSAVTLDEQIHKLVTMLDLVVHWLDVPDKLVPVLKKLGERHSTYGVQDDHFGKVGAALIGTLEEGLGDKFTPELRSAWTEAFVLISSLMRRGAAKISGAFPVAKPTDALSLVVPRKAAGFDAA
jgi:methyl-accepting chemotaxis protein